MAAGHLVDSKKVASSGFLPIVGHMQLRFVPSQPSLFKHRADGGSREEANQLMNAVIVEMHKQHPLPECPDGGTIGFTNQPHRKA
jgi:hypothetical protein